MGTKAYLGLDLGTGEEVREPLAHLGIFGQTRRAGKTTSLRELLRRLDREDQAEYLVFRTGTGEIAFPDAYPSPPFFRARLDWQAVEKMLWTFLSEKPKIYRPIIMRAVRGAHSLEDVHRNIVDAGKKSHVGWVVDRTYELDVYFQEILPWLREHKLETMVYLRGSGGNVVDLEGWPATVQQLVVAATLDSLMAGGKRSHPLVVVLPEARRFIPSDHATPVTPPADFLTSQGAKLNLFMWVDSQSLTGVNQQILRNFALILQGVQSSDLELKRVAKALEVPPKRIRSLKTGDFVLYTADGVRTIHVPLTKEKPLPKNREEDVDAKERKEYETRIKDLETQVKLAQDGQTILERQLQELRVQVKSEHDRAEANARVAAARTVERIKSLPRPNFTTDDGEPEAAAKAAADAERSTEPVDLRLTQELPSLSTTIKRPSIETDEGEMVGRIALLISEGFWDDGAPKKQADAGREFTRRGYGSNFTSGGQSVRLSEAFGKMTVWGFFRREAEGYVLVPGVKKRVKVVEE